MSIATIVKGNTFSLAIPLQVYAVEDGELVLRDYTPESGDAITIRLKGERRNYTYVPSTNLNVAYIQLGGYEVVGDYAVEVEIVKDDDSKLTSYRFDQLSIVESIDELNEGQITEGISQGAIYLDPEIFIAGKDGRGIVSIIKTATSGLVDTYTITYTDNTTSTFNVTNGKDGINGQDGADGADGVGIASIAKTGTSGLVDTYTITMTNGTTYTYQVTNGKDGEDGVDGTDGVGIVSITKTSTAGLVDTYTITYSDNTTSTFTVTNGAAGEAGATIASIEKTATVGKVDTYTITMTDGSTFDFEVTNGLDGVDLGLANIVNDLTTGGEGNALSAEMGKALNEKIENKGDDVYMVTSSSLADAIAEVPSDNRKVGLVIGLPGEGASVRRYKYMGKYYTDVDWLSEGAWLDLDNAEKYKVYYFRLCPTIEGHVDNASINSSGVVTTGTKHVTDFIAIPESGVSIGGGWMSRYTLYDSEKNKVSTALLYGGVTFSYAATTSAYIRLEYETNTPVWLYGYTKGSSSAGAPASLPHVEVVENYENLIDYEDNAWAGNVGPFIRLRKGETINLLVRGTDTVATEQYMTVQPYNINQESYGNAQSSITKYVMPIDGYVKIGKSRVQTAIKNARYNIISKSIARTRAKKRMLVVGDSISVYTWDNTLSKDMKQGYPFFLATQGNHEISVTNQAVSGNTSGAQLTSLQNKDMSVYDAVTIFIGTNDYGYNTPVATFKSNIASMVDYITAQNPACKIVFFTLIHRASAWNGTTEVPNSTGAVLSDYCTAIKEVAQLYGLPVLDLWNECQCNFNYTIYKENYSSQESEASGDGLHPSNEAHKLFIYPLVREILKRLL